MDDLSRVNLLNRVLGLTPMSLAKYYGLDMMKRIPCPELVINISMIGDEKTRLELYIEQADKGLFYYP